MLPTQKTPPKRNLHDLTVLVYGPHKYGKSGFCSQADNALFLATEPGLNHLEVYQQPISTWDELLIAAKDIAEGKHAFRTVIIDTVDNAYRMCADYICQRFKIEHESDLEYGKGYALVNGEFHRVLNKLALLPYGLFLVSHSQEKEIETRTGKYTKIVPTLPDKARKLVLGLVDIILFGDLEATTGPDGKPAYRRVLRTKPSTAYEAGDRTGRLPEVIDLDFAVFMAAFAQGAGRAGAASTTSPASSPATGTAAASTAAPASPPTTTSTAAAGTTAPASSPPTTATTTATSPPAASPSTSRERPATSPPPAKPANPPATAAAKPRAAAAATTTPATKPRVASAATTTPATSSPRPSTATSTTNPTNTAASRPRTTSTASR